MHAWVGQKRLNCNVFIRASRKERARRATKDLHAANNLSSQLKFRRFVKVCRCEDSSVRHSASLLFINTDQISVEPCRTTELSSATAVQRNSGRAAKRETHCGPHALLPEQPGLTCSSNGLFHAMPCSIGAQAHRKTMARRAAPLAQRQRRCGTGSGCCV